MNIEEKVNNKINYQVIENPSQTEHILYCFPGCFQGGWVEGVVIEFPEFGWCGSFAFGDISPNAISGIYNYPDENKLLIVSNGQGFIVNVAHPDDTVELKEQPIMGVLFDEKRELVVIYDFVRFTAFNSAGRLWKTDALSYDGIKILEVLGNIIVSKSWSAPLNKWVEFRLDVLTGAYEGGAR